MNNKDPEVIYMVVKRTDTDDLGFRFHTGPTVDETLHSIRTLRNYHPDIRVYVYTDIPRLHLIPAWKELGDISFMPVGVEREEVLFPHENLWEKNKWQIPDLRLLFAKLDCMILHPGQALFLDSDTEVCAPLDEIFDSDDVWMHAKEFLFRESTYKELLTTVSWPPWGIDPNHVRDYWMINSGVVWVPWRYRMLLLAAKRWMISNAYTHVGSSGSNRLKEQIALSCFFQAKTDGVRTSGHLINHLWWRRGSYGKHHLGGDDGEQWRWYPPVVHVKKAPKE
mgnify:CR=1 FL=1